MPPPELSSVQVQRHKMEQVLQHARFESCCVWLLEELLVYQPKDPFKFMEELLQDKLAGSREVCEASDKHDARCATYLDKFPIRAFFVLLGERTATDAPEGRVQDIFDYMLAGVRDEQLQASACRLQETERTRRNGGNATDLSSFQTELPGSS